MKKANKNNMKTPTFSCGLLLCLILLALTPTVQAVPQNLTWTTSNSSISEGAGTWNQGSASLPSGAPWYNGSTYGNTMASGDNVTFGGGTAGTVGTITIGTGGVNPGNVTLNAPFNGAGGIGYTIGAAATPAVTMSGGTISINTITNTVFTAQLNGTFSLTNLNSTKGLLVLANNGTQTSANTINVGVGSTLQLGNNSSAGTVGAAVITNNGAVNYRRSSAVTGNLIVGSGNVNYQLRLATVTLNSASTYAGATSFGYSSANQGACAINWGVNNALPTNTPLAISAGGGSPANQITADLKGFNQALGSLSGGDAVYTIFTSSSGAPVLTISGTNAPTTYAGQLNGSLALTKSNTNSLTLNAANSYTGNTTINGGTLALGASGSISSTPQISIGAGGTFDVSAISAYALGTSTLAASGTTNAAIIKGNSGGTIDFGSQAITLNFDGTNAPLTISQGQLLLNGNSFTVTRATPLAAGTYTLITNFSSTISSNGTFTVGGSAVSGSVANLLVGGNAVTLQLVPAPVSTNNSTVVASPTTLPADNLSTSTVTVTLKDSANNPLIGVSVDWSVSGAGNTVIPATTGVTDGTGHTTFTLQSIKAQTNLVTVTVGAVTLTNSLPIVFTNSATPSVLTWDPAHNATQSDGAGTWDIATANWANNSTDVAWPNNGKDQAVFGTSGSMSANYVVTLSAPISVGGLTFNNTVNQYQLTGQFITLSNTPSINVAANALISSPLTGSGFTKDGAGVLRIDGNATNFSSNITVNNGTLQIGNNGVTGNLGTGTITLIDPAAFTVRKGTGGSMTLSNIIGGTTTGTVGFQLNGGSVITLAEANTYSAASTYLQPTAGGTVGTLKLGINNALPTTSVFNINANGASLQTFDLAGFNQTLASLGGSGTATTAFITNSVSGTASTLTLSGAGVSTTFGGLIGGNVDLTLAGSGSTLTVQQTNSLSALSIVTITNGAALDLAFTGTNQIAGLVINGVSKAPGVYSATTDSPSLADTGYLLVVPQVTINPNPPVMQVSYSAGTMSLAWPTNLGWILQSNSVSLTSTGAWFNYPADGSVSVTNVTVTVNPAKTNVFFRMLKP